MEHTLLHDDALVLRVYRLFVGIVVVLLLFLLLRLVRFCDIVVHIISGYLFDRERKF